MAASDKPVIHLHGDHVDLDATDIENVIADLAAARDEIRRLNS